MTDGRCPPVPLAVYVPIARPIGTSLLTLLTRGREMSDWSIGGHDLPLRQD
jgi:hypothetical protein